MIEVQCEKDSDCNVTACEYCKSTKLCVKYKSEYCNKNSCGIGDGDCDKYENTCEPGYECGEDNFLDFHPNLTHCGRQMNRTEACILLKGSKTKIANQHENVVLP